MSHWNKLICLSVFFCNSVALYLLLYVKYWWTGSISATVAHVILYPCAYMRRAFPARSGKMRGWALLGSMVHIEWRKILKWPLMQTGGCCQKQSIYARGYSIYRMYLRFQSVTCLLGRHKNACHVTSLSYMPPGFIALYWSYKSIPVVENWVFSARFCLLAHAIYLGNSAGA